MLLRADLTAVVKYGIYKPDGYENDIRGHLLLRGNFSYVYSHVSIIAVTSSAPSGVFPSSWVEIEIAFA